MLEEMPDNTFDGFIDREVWERCNSPTTSGWEAQFEHLDRDSGCTARTIDHFWGHTQEKRTYEKLIDWFKPAEHPESFQLDIALADTAFGPWKTEKGQKTRTLRIKPKDLPATVRSLASPTGPASVTVPYDEELCDNLYLECSWSFLPPMQAGERRRVKRGRMAAMGKAKRKGKRANEALAHDEVYLWQQTGRQDAANVIDVNELEEMLGAKPSKAAIKKWLLAEGSAPDDFPEGATKAEKKKLVEAWADGWSSYAEHVMAHREAREGMARDYRDLEAALLGAQSKLDATHVQKVGSHISIFTPSSRGYIKRTLFRQGGNLHWPEQSTTVAELPKGAQMIHEVIDTPWDIERDEAPVSHRRAAEEAPRGEIDETAGDELRIYADNEAALYGQKKSIVANIQRRIKNGTYDPKLAPKLWLYWVDAAAKKYAKEFGGEWNVIFNKATREHVAAQLAEDEYGMITRGEYAAMEGRALAHYGPEREGNLTKVEFTRGGIQVSTINGVKYATLFDLRDPMWPREFSLPMRVRYQVGQKHHWYDLLEANIVEVLGKPERAPRGAGEAKRTLRSYRGVNLWREALADGHEVWRYEDPRTGQTIRAASLKTAKDDIDYALDVQPGLKRTARRKEGGGEAREVTPSAEPAIPWVKVTRDAKAYEAAIARGKEIGPIDNPRKVYDLLNGAMAKEDQEVFVVVLLDVHQNLRGVAEVHRGGRSRVAVSTPDVLRVVVASGAEGFIVCHNHPSTSAKPSDADKDLTDTIRSAADEVDVTFCDHVVIGMGEYYSFEDGKLTKVN